MAGETRIISFEAGSEQASEQEILESQEEAAPDEASEAQFEDEVASSGTTFLWLTPGLAVLAGLAWTAFFVWARLGELQGGANANLWTQLVADWAVPVLLIGVVYLLVMRNSRAEAKRFSETASKLSEESAQLETRLTVVNRELSLAREFVAAQSRDLESLGRIAADRLSEHADRLQELIRDNGVRVDTIGTVSEAALDNMEKLRGQLPVIASSARDVTNNIGNAGRAAHTQLGEMIDGFKRLNEFGQACEHQVLNMRSTVDESIAEFQKQSEQLSDIASSRFAALAERGTEFRSQLDTQETEALAAIRNRAATLSEEIEETRRRLDGVEEESLTSLRARLSSLRDESSAISQSLRESEGKAQESWRAAITRLEKSMNSAMSALENTDRNAMAAARSRLDQISEQLEATEHQISQRLEMFSQELETRRAQAEANDQEATERFSERLARLDEEIFQRRAAQEEHSASLSAHSEKIAEDLAVYARQMDEIAAQGNHAEERIAASIGTLSEKLNETSAVLSTTDQDVEQLTEASIRLLELIRACSEQTDVELSHSLQASEDHLTGLESRIEALKQGLEHANGQGDNLSSLIETAKSATAAISQEIPQLQESVELRNEAFQSRLAEIQGLLNDVEQQCERISEKSQSELSDAIEKLMQAARDAAAGIGTDGAVAVSKLASRLGEQSSVALDRAMRNSAAETAGQLEQAAAHAAGLSREATLQLRDQLGKVNELVDNLERRVARARDRAAEQVDNDFARRIALITEALNSNAIDIAKSLSTDVSDTAWSAYLKGDRGIFTRRTVNLLESGDAKAISQLYERDQDFREHVSRYIHDFEAILRQILSTRDGNALGVTLLSSDIGKLYVALAQAIKRFRN